MNKFSYTFIILKMSSHSFRNEYSVPIEICVTGKGDDVCVSISSPSTLCEWNLTSMEAEYLTNCLKEYFIQSQPIKLSSNSSGSV